MLALSVGLFTDSSWMNKQLEWSNKIKSLAHAKGFSFVGIAKAQELTEEARSLEKWLEGGHHGKMKYMENYFDKRIDPTKLVPGAKSVVSLMYNYYPKESTRDKVEPRLSKYALGEDYHQVIKSKLRELLDEIRSSVGAVDGRCFVDSAPVMERDWARHAGVGWKGKNTLLINPKAGSYFFLAELIIDIELTPDQPMRDYCGTCRKCIDACPTEAISQDGHIVDGSKCISYLTIELKEEIPSKFSEQMDGWMFGCDVCQDVCPWNRFSTPHSEPAFNPSEDLQSMDVRDWQELTEEVFRKVFKKSAVKRTKFVGLQRNIAFLKLGEND